MTLLFGAGVTTCIVISGSLAGTAAAWYWLLSRPLGLNRFAAAVGGLFAAFAPPLVNESGFGHQHLVARFLVPIIVWRFILLADGVRPVRRGLIFGAVLAYQAFINPETLLYTTISVMVFAAAYALQRPREARAIAPRMIRGLAVGGATALVLLITPVWYQFFGPQHNGKPPVDAQPFHADLLDYVGWPVASSLVDPAVVGRWTTQVYPVLGVPVVLVLLAFGWRLLRNPVFGSIVAVLAATSIFSLGTVISLRHAQDAATYTDEGFPGPWRLVGRLPVFQWVVPERWGMMAAAVAGVALAFILDDAMKRWRQGARVFAPVVIGLTLAACATLTPAPFDVRQLSPLPNFITAGTWREFVAPGGSLVPVPASWDSELTGLRWAAASNGDIAIPSGYFLGPADGGKGTTFGVPDRWTIHMLKTVAFTGNVWRIQPGERESSSRIFAIGARACLSCGRVSTTHRPYAPASRRSLARPARWTMSGSGMCGS